MQAFVAVVDAGGYSPAARRIGRSKALLSKYVRELEDELGALLINRTTRKFSLTEAGQLYFDSAGDILARIEALKEKVHEAGSGLGGTLRIAAPRSLSSHDLCLPLIDFAKAHPELKLEVALDDRFVDLVEERFDVAIRVTQLEDSAMIARRLADNRIIICATPEFISRHGRPEHPSEIAGMPAIIDTNSRSRDTWHFTDPEKGEISVNVTPVLEVNDPEMCKHAALAGLGITKIPEFSLTDEIQSGKLVALLETYMPMGVGYFAVYPQRRHVPAKVRAFVDFMADWFRDRR